MSDTLQQGSRRGYVIGFVLSVVLTAIPFWLVMTGPLSTSATAIAIFACAGVQVKRNLSAAPVPAPLGATRADAHRRVVLSGRFCHARKTRVKAVSERRAGFWLLTPLVAERGTVLVNRGFVPAEPARIHQPSGVVTVIGLPRLTDPGGGFPVGGLTVDFRNNHLLYALTWFGLAVLTIWAMARLVRSR